MQTRQYPVKCLQSPPWIGTHSWGLLSIFLKCEESETQFSKYEKDDEKFQKVNRGICLWLLHTVCMNLLLSKWHMESLAVVPKIKSWISPSEAIVVVVILARNLWNILQRSGNSQWTFLVCWRFFWLVVGFFPVLEGIMSSTVLLPPYSVLSCADVTPVIEVQDQNQALNLNFY